MTLRLQFEPYESNITDKIYGIDYRCHSKKCTPCNTLKDLRQKICVICYKIYNIYDYKQENDIKKLEKINKDNDWTPTIFFYCNYCKLCCSIHEKLCKLYWFPLFVLSDFRICDSLIDCATRFTFHYINNILNNRNVKIYEKLLISKSLYNQLDKKIKHYYSPINKLLNILQKHTEYVLFYGNLQVNINDYLESHQIVLLYKDKKLHLLDNDRQTCDEIAPFIQKWRYELQELLWMKIPLLYYSFPINAYAVYDKQKIKNKKNKYKLILKSGCCSPNSNFQGIICATYYNQSNNIFHQLYDKCKYVKYILNDYLVTFFPQSHSTLFVMWSQNYTIQWTDFWKVCNKKMSLEEYLYWYTRMFVCIYIYTIYLVRNIALNCYFVISIGIYKHKKI